MHRAWQGRECQDELGHVRTQLSQMVLGFLIFQEMERSGKQSKRDHPADRAVENYWEKDMERGSFSCLGCIQRIRLQCSTHRAL